MIKVSIQLVNGGLNEFIEPDSIVGKLRRLKSEGLEGKALVDSLITDDWGPPPTVIHLTGTTDDGQKINERIIYE